MFGVTIDICLLSMCGSRQGLVKLLQMEASKARNNFVMQFYGVIHQENFCANLFKVDNVMFVVIKTVNFICSKLLPHKQFQLLRSSEAEFEYMRYYFKVRWLTWQNVTAIF